MSDSGDNSDDSNKTPLGANKLGDRNRVTLPEKVLDKIDADPESELGEFITFVEHDNGNVIIDTGDPY